MKRLFLIPSLAQIRKWFLDYFGFQGTALLLSPSEIAPANKKWKQRGSALIMAAIFMLVAAVLLVTGLKMVAVGAKQSKESELYLGEAENAARAGLQDAYGWFLRNTTTAPVRAFKQNYLVGQTVVWGTDSTGTTYLYPDQPFQPANNTINAQKSDTLDPTIGLVQEYSVDSSANSLDANAVYFARYEVKKQPNPILAPSPALTATPDPFAVHDVTGNRVATQLNGDGIVWSVTSTGYIYKRVDKTFASGTPTPGVFYFPGQWAVPYNVAPNKVVATARMSTEFRKLIFQLPMNGSTTLYGAVYCNKARNDVILPTNDQGLLNGLAAASGTYSAISLGTTSGSNATPSNADTVNLNGPVTYQNSSSQLSANTVFGMSLSDVQFLSDYRGDVNNPLNITSDWKLSYYNGSVTFGYGNAKPYDRLHTNGILIVNGDLVLKGGASDGSVLPSSFGGIVFCTGNVTIQDGSEVDGCIFLGQPYIHNPTPGKLTLSGQPGEFGQVNLNTNLMATAMSLVATYREDVTARKTLLVVPGMP